MPWASGKKIVAIDPGQTTGIAVHYMLPENAGMATGTSDRHEQEWRRLEMGPDEHHTELYRWLVSEEPDEVVCEEFTYRIIESDGTKMPGIVLVSKEYIGVVKLYCQLTKKPLTMQMVGNVKPFWTHDKLKALGLYNAPQGRQHMNDATAHLLHHVVNKLGRKDYLFPLRPKLA